MAETEEEELGELHPDGDCIGHFVVGKIKGHGASGDVFAAKSTLSGNHVAIKFMSKHLLSLNNSPYARVENEISLHKQLLYPFVATYYNWFEDSRYYYIAMELCETDLETFIRRRQSPLDTEHIRTLFFQIVDGLKYLHDFRIIHRDLKPKNILLRDNARTAKICDFGFARRLFNDNDAYPTDICGTPPYMDPQPLGRHRKVDEASDIWSLGALLYFMATAEPIVEAAEMKGKTLYEVNEMIRSRNFSFEKVQDWQVRRLIEAMMVKDPSERPTAEMIRQNSFFTDEQRASVTIIKKTKSNQSFDSGNGSLNRSNTSHNSSSNFSSPSSFSSRSGFVSNYSNAPERALSRINESMSSSVELRSTTAEGKSVSGKNNTVQPLNTKNLRPQRVKFGSSAVCSILKSGEVLVEFLKPHEKALAVKEFILISSDGKLMHEYQPQNGPLLLSDSPPPFEENYLWTYELSGLTSRSDDRKRARALAKYQSAAMFVETALSKTAKHWLCTDLALVKLMSNEPPNVESTFHEKGFKIVHGAKKILMREGTKILYSDPAPPLRLHDYREYWEHHLLCRTRLFEQERQLNEANQKRGGITVVAMGCGRKPEKCRQPSNKPPDERSYSSENPR